MIKTILVPVDGSEHAGKAVEIAGDLAGKYDASITLLHVTLHGEAPANLRRMAEIEHLVEAPEISSPAALNIPAGTASALRENEERRESHAVFEALGNGILRRAEQVGRDHGATRIKKLLVEGDPTDQIIKHAEQEDADLIVMGSRGLSEIKGLLMGSVSHKVASLARCTCITVK